MKKGTDPAFPLAWESQGNYGERVFNETFGMSTRLYLAGMAMQGLMVQAIPDRTNQNTPENNRMRAQFALDMADELIKQEEETR